MSTYQYTCKSNGGPDLVISKFGGEPSIWVSADEPGGRGSYINPDDVPTLALELLKAAGHADLAGYIVSAKAAREAAEKAEAEAAEKKLQERRDALRREMGFGYRYEMSSAGVQRAINRIIELEDGASRD